MEKFSLKKVKNDIDNTKQKAFIKYLYEIFNLSEEEEFDNDYFSLLNEDDLIESLNYYIKHNSITSKTAGNNYITYLEEFFKILAKSYDIKNDIFTNVELIQHFRDRANKIVSTLQDPVNKEIATDNQQALLIEGIDKYLSTHRDIEEEIYDEINKYSPDQKHLNIYHRYVSIIATKLILRFGIKNLTLVSLNRDDLNLENNIITINHLSLQLGSELKELFSKYVKMREYILKKYSSLETRLFIKINSQPYLSKSNGKKATDYLTLFIIMQDYVKTESAELFSAKRIYEMLHSGLSIISVSKLSGWKPEKCLEILEKNSNEAEGFRKLQDFLENKSITQKKGYLKCPFCGTMTEATSDRWVLVQFDGNPKKYLACKKCKGQNGKHGI